MFNIILWIVVGAVVVGLLLSFVNMMNELYTLKTINELQSKYILHQYTMDDLYQLAEDAHNAPDGTVMTYDEDTQQFVFPAGTVVHEIEVRHNG